MQSIIKHEFSEHTKVSMETIKSVEKPIEIAANLCIESLKKDNKILLFGNGGSAADAQHIAAELVGRYKTQRKGLSAIALTTDTSAITSIANDYGYLHVFDRQVEALANEVIAEVSVVSAIADNPLRSVLYLPTNSAAIC